MLEKRIGFETGADEIHPPNYHQMFSNNIEALREIVREVANLDRATSWRVRCLMVKPSLKDKPSLKLFCRDLISDFSDF